MTKDFFCTEKQTTSYGFTSQSKSVNPVQLCLETRMRKHPIWFIEETWECLLQNVFEENCKDNLKSVQEMMTSYDVEKDIFESITMKALK